MAGNTGGVYGYGGGGDRASGYYAIGPQGQRIPLSNPGADSGYDSNGVGFGTIVGRMAGSTDVGTTSAAAGVSGTISASPQTVPAGSKNSTITWTVS